MSEIKKQIEKEFERNEIHDIPTREGKGESVRTKKNPLNHRPERKFKQLETSPYEPPKRKLNWFRIVIAGICLGFLIAFIYIGYSFITEIKDKDFATNVNLTNLPPETNQNIYHNYNQTFILHLDDGILDALTDKIQDAINFTILNGSNNTE